MRRGKLRQFGKKESTLSIGAEQLRRGLMVTTVGIGGRVKVILLSRKERVGVLELCLSNALRFEKGWCRVRLMVEGIV